MTVHHYHTGKRGSRRQAWRQEQLSDDSLEPQQETESKLDMEVFRLSSPPAPPMTSFF